MTSRDDPNPHPAHDRFHRFGGGLDAGSKFWRPEDANGRVLAARQACACLYIAMNRSAYPSICLSIYLSIYLSVHLPIRA
jgi:hypothetical protein